MVWDLPTRLFHWGFVASIAGAYISGDRGAVDWHEMFGLSALGLIVFRLIWGFIGHETARFKTFLPAPTTLFAYLKNMALRQTQGASIGHNPAGAMAVISLLLLMGTMAVTGLWTGDDIVYDAPLTAAGFFPQWASPMAVLHEQTHIFILPLIALHIGAIIAHRLWLGEKLVSRMVTGGQGPAVPDKARTRLGLVLLSVCVGGALCLSALTPAYR